MAGGATTPRERAAAVVRALAAAGSAARRATAEWYFPTAERVLGVANPVWRPVVRTLARELGAAPPREVIATARALVAERTLEGRQAAYELLSRHRAAAAALDLRTVEALGRGMDNWASVDAFSCFVAGPAWRAGIVTDAAVARWARSPDRWWRRAALASTVPLNLASRGGRGDVPRTLAVCARLAADPDDMVQKALSWALCTLVQHDAAAVRAFVAQHAGVVSARVKREVNNKLHTGRKNPRGARAVLR